VNKLNLELGKKRARAGALLMLALPGGAYIFQGEELALPEVRDIPEHRLEDPRWNMSNNLDKGRDGCRVPLPWRSSSDSAYGFSGTASVTPDEAWLPQPKWWGDYSVESQDKDPASTLNMYRTALEIRHKEAGLGDGDMEWVDFGADVLAFRRPGNFICLVNFGAEIKLPEGELLVSSSPIRDFTLPPDTAVWLRTK
jgi:alpha-glucosidase